MVRARARAAYFVPNRVLCVQNKTMKRREHDRNSDNKTTTIKPHQAGLETSGRGGGGGSSVSAGSGEQGRGVLLKSPWPGAQVIGLPTPHVLGAGGRAGCRCYV
jgi:hypothetical protein